jgi:DNA-binding response OmpR family regulator
MSDPRPPQSGTSEQHVLIVDDNSAICILLRTVIERRGYSVLAFSEPEAALGHMRERKPHLRFAIIDVGLAGMSGIDFARHLRELQPDVGLVLSTGRNLTDEQLDFTKRHGALFLPKPFGVPQLNALLTTAEQRTAGPGKSTGT